MRRDRVALVLSVVIGVSVAWLACSISGPLFRFATTAHDLPLWDEAKYGLDGARLADALARFDLPRFLALVYDLDVWPPFFPLVESVVFLIAGNGFAVARCLVVALSVALVIAAWWASYEVARESPAVGAIVAALLVTSPLVQVFSAQVMLEVPGALLYVVCLGFYARHLHTGTRATIVATGVASAALFFTKYNYGLLWLVPLLLNEAWLASGGFVAMVGRAVGAARRIDWRRPFTLFVALYVAALAAVAITGGGTLPVGAKGVSVTSIGNPLFLLVVILIARAARHPRQSWARFRTWERSLSRRPRALFWTVGAPAIVWLLLPPHLRGFVDFVENRSDGPSLLTADGWLFYPRLNASLLHWKAVEGWIVLVAAITALARIGRVATSVRIVLLCVAVTMAALTLHPYKEPRFLLIAAPVWWLAAAWNVVTLVQLALVRARVARALSPALVQVALAFMALMMALRGATGGPPLRAGFAGYTVPASTAPLVDRVLDLAGERPTLVLGTWNQASPPLLEWRSLQRASSGGARARESLETVVPSRGGGAAEQIVRRLRGERAPEQVVLLEVDPETAPSAAWAAAYAAETAWLDPVRAELDAGTASYGKAVQSFGSSGYRVRVYRLARPATPASSPAG